MQTSESTSRPCNTRVGETRAGTMSDAYRRNLEATFELLRAATANVIGHSTMTEPATPHRTVKRAMTTARGASRERRASPSRRVRASASASAASSDDSGGDEPPPPHPPTSAGVAA